MIISREKNQKAAKKIIADFVSENKNFPVTNFALEEKLKEFLKYFSKHIMERVEKEDCYFVDLLDDIERME